LKIVGIVCSPRRNGNTAQLIRAVLKGYGTKKRPVGERPELLKKAEIIGQKLVFSRP